MEEGFGLLDQINKAFWKKNKKEEPVKNRDVKIDGECLESAECSSEYWSNLAHRRKKSSGINGVEGQLMGNQESEPRTTVNNGLEASCEEKSGGKRINSDETEKMLESEEIGSMKNLEGRNPVNAPVVVNSLSTSGETVNVDSEVKLKTTKLSNSNTASKKVKSSQEKNSQNKVMKSLGEDKKDSGLENIDKIVGLSQSPKNKAVALKMATKQSELEKSENIVPKEAIGKESLTKNVQAHVEEKALENSSSKDPSKTNPLLIEQNVISKVVKSKLSSDESELDSLKTPVMDPGVSVENSKIKAEKSATSKKMVFSKQRNIKKDSGIAGETVTISSVTKEKEPTLLKDTIKKEEISLITDEKKNVGKQSVENENVKERNKVIKPEVQNESILIIEPVTNSKASASQPNEVITLDETSASLDPAKNTIHTTKDSGISNSEIVQAIQGNNLTSKNEGLVFCKTEDTSNLVPSKMIGAIKMSTESSQNVDIDAGKTPTGECSPNIQASNIHQESAGVASKKENLKPVKKVIENQSENLQKGISKETKNLDLQITPPCSAMVTSQNKDPRRKESSHVVSDSSQTNLSESNLQEETLPNICPEYIAENKTSLKVVEAEVSPNKHEKSEQISGEISDSNREQKMSILLQSGLANTALQNQPSNIASANSDFINIGEATTAEEKHNKSVVTSATSQNTIVTKEPSTKSTSRRISEEENTLTRQQGEIKDKSFEKVSILSEHNNKSIKVPDDSTKISKELSVFSSDTSIILPTDSGTFSAEKKEIGNDSTPLSCVKSAATDSKKGTDISAIGIDPNVTLVQSICNETLPVMTDIIRPTNKTKEKSVVSDIIECMLPENTAEQPKKGVEKKTKVNISKRKISSDISSENATTSPTRRMSEVPRNSRRNSGATSPECDNRRDSGVMSPLSFNSIQDKILALSRESSIADIPKKRLPKVKKLDDKILAAVKEPSKENSKEIVKITPKINSILETKILKFGEPSTGAKIPVKKPENSLSYSAVGGYAIKEEASKDTVDKSIPSTPRGTKKIKPKAPQPPGSEPMSIPSTPSTDRKIKKVKGKAPQPPVKQSEDLSSLTNEVSSLLKQTEAFSKQVIDHAAQSTEAETRAITPLVKESGPKDVVLHNSVTPEEGDVNYQKLLNVEQKLPLVIESGPKNEKPVDMVLHNSGTPHEGDKKDQKKILNAEQRLPLLKEIGPKNEERIDVVFHNSVTPEEVVKNDQRLLDVEQRLQEEKEPVKVCSQVVNAQSVTPPLPQKVNKGPSPGSEQFFKINKPEKSEEKLNNEIKSIKLENLEIIPNRKIENQMSLTSWMNKVPKIVNDNFECQFGRDDDEFADDCETPKATRRNLHLYNEQENPHSEWLGVMEESRRVQDELRKMSRRLGDSSGSESFHTPSPRPLMFTSRGEVIGSPGRREISPEWTPSPDRDLFTPEGSPLSEFSDASYDHYVASVDFSVRSVSLPRRVFPQLPVRPASYHEDWKEESPVVFDAGLSFDLCSRRTPVRQHIRPSPAYSEPNTASNSLSCRIAEFLSRTDHVMEEWRRLGRADPRDMKSLVELPTHRVSGAARSKSAANIMIKGFQYYSGGSSKSSWRSPSVSRYSVASDRTLADLEELNEMTADLTEERLSGAQAAERLEAETSERIRVEQELALVSNQKSQLEQVTERMELELHYAKAYDNGFSDGEEFGEGRDDSDVYKKKCARLKRENDMLRQQLRQQHEDDLEQLVGLKKQLEKRLADANEEVDEQRQVAGEWKKKTQKLQAELNDFRIIVQEQNSRNTLLEKKQRKFDGEIQLLQDELRAEKNAKERISRDREVAMSNKCSIEQTLSSVRMELELKEEEVRRLTHDLDDLSLGGTTEQDITMLRKAKHDMEKKIKEQDDELDDLAGQVSLLESAKLKLEMSIESIRKDHRKEIAQKDDEIEEVRSNSIKKLKSVEAALEQEYEERSLLLRSKHDLERRVKDLEEHARSNRAADEDALVRLRKDLRKTKALLRDAQVMLDRAKEDSPGKAALKALKNQLEDTELARASAVKAKQKLMAELNETNSQLEDAMRQKGEAESRAQAVARQVNTLKTQLEENEEELSELMKKYNQHLANEEARNLEAAATLADVEAERNSLREQLAEATARLEAMSVVDPAPDMNQRRLEITIQDLKSRLELDGAVRKRLEVQISRLKEKMERLSEESNQYRVKEQSSSDQVRKLQISLRDCKEELAVQSAREQDIVMKKRDLEKKLEASELALSAARGEVKLSAQRVQDLQAALTAEINSESEESSDGESG